MELINDFMRYYNSHPDEVVIGGMVALLVLTYVGCEAGKAYYRGKLRREHMRREQEEGEHIRRMDKE